MEKQIEEMAKEIASILTDAAHMACEDVPFAPLDLDMPCIGKIACHRCKEARMLIAKGYRKQSEPNSCGHEKGGGWISVEERLPDEYGGVICHTHSGSIIQLTYNPRYRLFNVSCDNVDCAMAVDYWMPLPEPPKMKGGAE